MGPSMPRKPNRVRYLAAFCVGGIVLLSIVAWFAFPYFSFAEQFRRSKPAQCVRGTGGRTGIKRACEAAGAAGLFQC
jgi:hypothetical protein